MSYLKHKLCLYFLCCMLVLGEAYADGFYVAHLDREFDNYEPSRSYRPQRKKIYVYRDSPRRHRPKREKIYIYKEAPPPPPPPPQKVYIYNESEPDLSASSRPIQSQRTFHGSGIWAQNNFMLFKLGGFKIDGFGGNSEINSSMQGLALGIGVGHIFSQYLSGSIEFDIFSSVKGEKLSGNTLRKWKVSSNMLTTNAAISVFPDQPVDFYVKVGLGLSYNKSGTYEQSSDGVSYSYPGASNFNFAWRGGCGLKVNILPDIDTGIEYMYTDRGTFKTKNIIKSSGSDTISPSKEANFTDHTLSLVVSKKFS